MSAFSFDEAFSRNLGWLTEQDLSLLKRKRVAIAGLGGVGGSHVLTLARLGIGAFTLADFDTFELANFNRQAGANIHHLGREKTDVIASMARDINPGLDLRLFGEGVHENNVDDFLRDADIYLDGLDFFELAARRLIFKKCAEKRIPAVTAAPLGMGAALINFLPGGMTFDRYFRMKGNSDDDPIRFLIGLSPRLLQMTYLADDTRADFAARRVPSTPMGCEIASGMAATEVLKILLKRERVLPAPHGIQFDAYRHRFVRTWRPGGNNHPLQRLAFSLIKRRLSGKESLPKEKDAPKTTAERVLDLARWAPSGDNLQPWRFTLQGEREFLVAPDNRTRDVYFLNDGPKLLALGGLLETISVAATVEKCNAVIEREPSNADTASERIYRVRLEGTTDVDPLAPFIKMRATNRRSLSRAPLSQADREALESAAAPFHVLWLESDSARRKMSRMISRYTKIRLSIPEAFETHQKVIAWNSRYSADRIPDQAIGLDPVTLKLMRWAMKKWSRVRWMNRYLAGTWMPRLQLDLIPGRHCAAFAALLSPQPIMESDDFIAAGRAMQRFWLTLTRLGLQCQPQLAPLIFDSYVRDKIAFTADVKMLEAASALSPQLRSLLGEEDSQRAAFLCRVGFGQTARSRSLRKPLSQFLWPEKEG